MYKVYILNNLKFYEIKIYDKKMKRWSISNDGTKFANYSDALTLKNEILKSNNKNIRNVSINYFC